MDTVMSLSIYGDSEVSDRIRQRITALDSALDATAADSEIARLNKQKSAAVSEDTARLLDRSLDLCERLEGSFDITVYPAVLAWGFTTGDYAVPDGDTLRRLAAATDYHAVRSQGNTYTLPDDVMVDLGAVAKGYAADVCGELLRDSSAQAAVLSLGGTVLLYGQKPDGSAFRVGVADPDNPAAYFGYLSCRNNGVIATSGGYERYFEQDGTRYIHILDPKTARPVDNGTLSVTVVADSGTDADALSTALFVMGADEAVAYYRAHPDFDFILLTDDGVLSITDGIYDNFTLSDGYDFTVRQIAE